MKDYHPLTEDEVKALLGMVNAEPDKRTIHQNTQITAQVQVRLAQAIPGMLCPRPVDGPVAKKLNRLDHVFTGFTKGDTKDYVLSEIMKVIS
jgi:hypothetical protein